MEIVDKGIQVLQGRPEDLEQVLTLIKELAEYENALHEVKTNVNQMHEDAFGDNPVFGFFVAKKDSAVIGLALYYYRYSTWKGRSIYLEDLVVTESFRRQGIGSKLLHEVIAKAKKEEVALVTWQVLDWNTPAIQFYKERMNAKLDETWINCTIYKEDFDKVLKEGAL
ncbi:GNAT family N-acetyltransferase [Aureibacter tunicatorum]|uniref:GNAT superfamily N-acetyltransferase n=1 Tax=Aureibacter tunicatorum TaxID=866807 RepID=A0AAE4BQ65_9BACT|nr:GNAT family N-acetyltransferase [Aureibacter tunicatorum]MDR6237236.1 GNAT superfamily N-acetyltransferase [Aureibacter tunicatorum]BDD06228.1 N-acetyltransferase [Aureibacter tunicatorum]